MKCMRTYWRGWMSGLDRFAGRKAAAFLFGAIAIASAAGFFGAHALRQPQTGPINLATVFAVAAMLFHISSGLSGFIQSGEAVFLKKIGASARVLLSAFLHKQRLSLFLFLCIYCFLYMSGRDAPAAFVLLSAAASALSAYVCVLSVALLYCRFANRAVWIAKNIFLLCIIAITLKDGMGRFFSSPAAGDIAGMKGIAAVFSSLMEAFGNSAVIAFFCENLALSEPIFAIIAAVCLGAAAAACAGKVFYRPPFAFRFVTAGRGRGIIKTRPLNPAICFLKRDMLFLLRRTGYLVIQIGALALFIVLIFLGHKALVLLALVGLAAINTIFICDAYKLDACFMNVYRKLPLRFGRYVCLRVGSVFVFSLILPLATLIVCAVTGASDSTNLLIGCVLLVVLPLLLSLYWFGIMLHRFSEIAKTDTLRAMKGGLPPVPGMDLLLLLGFMFLLSCCMLMMFFEFFALKLCFALIPPGIVAGGLAKGRKIWKGTGKHAHN